MKRETAIVAPAYVNGTTIIQELGSKGVHVVVVDIDAKAIGFKSRFTKERVVLPKVDVFAEWLVSRQDLYGAVVVPTDDFFVRQIAERHEELSRHYKLAVAPREATLTALNKDRAYEVVRGLGYLIPESMPLDKDTDIKAVAQEFGFPAILKPVFGIAFQRDFKTKVFVVQNEDELRTGLQRAMDAGHRMVLQEIVPGADENIAACRGYVTDSGEVLGILTVVKLLSYPPVFGIGQIQEAREVPEIVEPTRRLLESIGYRGAMFGVEWKKHDRDGRWRFVEMNARSLMSIGMSKRAGADAIDMMWRDKTGRPQRPVGRTRWGVRHANLKNALLRHAGYPEARKNIIEYAQLYRPPVSFHILRLDDMRPFLADVWPLLARRFMRGQRS